jgi:hypothetical protein
MPFEGMKSIQQMCRDSGMRFSLTMAWYLAGQPS